MLSGDGVDLADGRRRGAPSGEAGRLIDAGDALGPVLAVALEAGGIPVCEVDLVHLAQVGGLVCAGLGPLNRGRVELGRAIHERDGTESVENHVVDTVEPEVAVVLEVQNGGSDQPIPKDVDRCTVVGAHPFLRCPIWVGLGPQIDVSQRVFQRGVDELVRLGIDLDDADESGLHLHCSLGRDPLQKVPVQVTAKLDVLSDVGRYGRIDVLGEPHAQLCGRERKRRLRCSVTRSSAVG